MLLVIGVVHSLFVNGLSLEIFFGLTGHVFIWVMKSSWLLKKSSIKFWLSYNIRHIYTL